MREVLFKQVEQMQSRLGSVYPQFELKIIPAMTYGNPGINEVLAKLQADPQDHILLFPLFPQYSATSTAPLYDAVARWIPKQRNLPGLTIIRDYYQHPLFIESLANSVREFQSIHGRAEKLLMSFHGIPQPYADKGDPYAERCRITAQRLAESLNLQPHEWACSFQSRFGKQEWIKPYTDELLAQWGQEGVKSVQVMSPAFSADCLETLEELAMENAETFKHAGGTEYAYIPALNNREDHLDLLTSLVKANLDTLTQTLAN